MSAAFLKWYLAALKSHPFAANMSTAVVLMSVGDMTAQGIEQSCRSSLVQLGDCNDSDDASLSCPPPTTVTNKPVLAVSSVALPRDSDSSSAASASSTTTTTTTLRSFALNRHSTLSPHLEVANCDYGISRLEWERPATANVLDATTPDSWQGLPLDGVRTSTMAFWAGAIQAPFFLALYRFYDRILPTAITPYAVGGRVALSFLSTIPFTAAFFGYGTVVHHLLHDDNKNGETGTELVLQDDDDNDDLAQFWTTMADKVQEKWSQDLPSTVQASAFVWAPFNTLNFSLVPPHLRPLCMMAMSAGWNCYLSLVQHKEASS